MLPWTSANTAAIAGGAKNGSGHLEHYNNTILISADRNGSTAFQETIRHPGLNGDFEVFLGECFSQDPHKDQPPSWHDPDNYSPLQLVETVNKATGKPVVLKAQITYPNFTTEFLEIPAQRKIFLHRNLFDSTLSRCIGQKTGHWFTTNNNDQPQSAVHIMSDFFTSRLAWRLERYQLYLPAVLDWCNECYRYETHQYRSNLKIVPNVSKQSVVTNYDELLHIFNQYPGIAEIELMVDSQIKELSK
jgi:hypothetical protein